MCSVAGCGTLSSATPIARVNGSTVTAADWRIALRAASVVSGSKSPVVDRAPQPSEVRVLAGQRVVEDYALSHDLANRAAARQQAESYVKTRLNARYHGRIQSALTDRAMSETQLTTYLTGQMVLAQTYAAVTRNAKPIRSSTVAEYYRRHRSEFMLPKTVEVRQILVKTSAQASRVLEQIKHGASFSAMALRYSRDASSAKVGGSLGFVELGKASGFPPGFYETMDRLKTGHYGIARTRLGYHIVEVLAVKPGSEAPLASVKSVIAAELLEREKASMFDAWASRIQHQARVEIL